MIRFLSPVILCAALVPGFDGGIEPLAPSAQDAPMSARQQKALDALLEQLGSADFEERQEAARKIAGFGKKALPSLEKAIAESDDAELRWQARRLARKIKRGEAVEVERSDRLEPAEPGRRAPPRDRPDRARDFDFDRRGVNPQNVEEFQRHMQRMMREMMRDGGLFPDSFGFPVGPGAQGKSSSQSVKIEVTPDGVRVEERVDRDGKEDKKVYEAPDMETLLKKHPHLEGKVSGWSSRRRGAAPRGVPFDDFGRDFGERIEREIRKKLEGLPKDLKRGMRFERDLDFDHDADVRIKIVTPDGVKELSGPEALKELGKDGIRFFGPGLRVERKGGDAKDHAPERLERVEVEKRAPGDGARLGVYVRPEVSADLREYLGIPEGVGIWVEHVVEGSLAAKAGLAKGDIVTKLDGRWIKGPDDVQNALRKAKGKVRIDFVRRGKTSSVQVDR